MKLHKLKPSQGSKSKRKRVGRGNASGMGTYSTRGMNGQKSRSGSSFYPGFEGGRTPLVKLLPKNKGFKSLQAKPEIVNLKDLEKNFKDGDIIRKTDLERAGLIESMRSRVKVLSEGDLKKKLTISVDKISKGAIKKIEAAGGTAKELKIPEDKGTTKKSGNKKVK